MMCILIEIFSHIHANGGKGLDDFNFGIFIGHFQSDGSERVKAQTCIEAHAHSHTLT